MTEQDSTVDTARLVELVDQYRKQKAWVDGAKTVLTELRAQISVEFAEVVPEGENWQDDHGHVKLVTRSGYVKYKSAEVHDLALVWAKSDDPIMKACGEMLVQKSEYMLSTESLYIK